MWMIEEWLAGGWQPLGGSYSSYATAQWELDQIEVDPKIKRAQFRIVRDPIYNL